MCRGHGATTNKNGVRELLRYPEYVVVESRKLF
jgi:hypothetical protein